MRSIEAIGLRCLLVFVALTSLTALAQPTATCPSFAFTVEKNDAPIPFDVAHLRRDRPELYQILRQRVVQDMYYGEDQANIGALVRNAYYDLPKRGEYPKDADERKRLVGFYVHGVLGAGGLLEKLKFECASFVDAVAAELSLVLSKEEGERLLGMVTDPLHEKFLVFMLRSKSTHKVPVQISANINTKLARSFNQDMIDSCKQHGVAPTICEKLQIRPPPHESQ